LPIFPPPPASRAMPVRLGLASGQRLLRPHILVSEQGQQPAKHDTHSAEEDGGKSDARCVGRAQPKPREPRALRGRDTRAQSFASDVDRACFTRTMISRQPPLKLGVYLTLRAVRSIFARSQDGGRGSPVVPVSACKSPSRTGIGERTALVAARMVLRHVAPGFT